MKTTLQRLVATCALVAAACLTACGSSTPSLQGAWDIEGSVTPSVTQNMTFTKMDFHADGTVTGTLLPQAPMLIAMADPATRAKALAPKPFSFSYVINTPGSMIVREPGNADALTVTYEIKGDELFMTVPVLGGSVVHVYKRSSE